MPMWGLGVSNLRQGTSSLGCFLQDSCTVFGVIFILSLTIWLFQTIFLSVSFNIMSSKLESDVPQMAFSVSYLYICRWMPRFLTLNKAIFHLLFWFLGERTGVLFVQIQQYRNMQQCWAWTLGCLLLCLLCLLLWIRGNIWPSQSKWTFALTSLSIPKTLYLMKKKGRETALSASYFPFPLFPVWICRFLTEVPCKPTPEKAQVRGTEQLILSFPPVLTHWQMYWLDLWGCKKWERPLSFLTPCQRAWERQAASERLVGLCSSAAAVRQLSLELPILSKPSQLSTSCRNMQQFRLYKTCMNKNLI